MDEAAKWIALNADRISVVGLLSIALIGGGWLFITQKLVPGWLYRDCAKELAEFKAQVDATAQSIAEKNRALEREVASLREEVMQEMTRRRR